MAEDVFEVFSLTSKLSLDTGQFDRAYNAARPKMVAMQGDLKKVEGQAKSTGRAIDKDLGAALSAVSPRLGALTTGGMAGLAIAGLTGLTAVVTGAAAGVFQLAQMAAEAGGELQDMSQQTNYSVETLSGLRVMARAAGTDINELSASLIIFQKNLAKGDDVFKRLGVTSRDNETALRQTFKALNEVQDGTIQTALAAEVFGKSGTKMLAVIKETHGDLDKAIDLLRRWGLIVSDEDAAAADEFGDKLDLLGLRLQGIGRQIGQETIPAFTAFFDTIGMALDANKTNWQEWGDFVAKAVLSAETIFGGFVYAVSKADWNNLIPGTGWAKFISEFYEGMDKTAAELTKRYNELTRGNPDVGRLPRGLRPGSGLGLGSTKKTGGRDAASLEMRAIEQKARDMSAQFDQEENDLKRSLERREMLWSTYLISLEGIENRRNQAANASFAAEADAAMKLRDLTARAQAGEDLKLKSAAEERRHKEALAKIEDQRINKTRDLAAMVQDFQKSQIEQLRQIQGQNKTALDLVHEFIAEYDKAGGVLSANQIHWLEFEATLIQTAKTAERLQGYLADIAETTPPIAPGGVPITKGMSPEELAKLGEPPPADPMAQWRRAIDDFSYDITYTIDNAIRTGFESGMTAGIKEFLRGILEMARSEALNELQRAIAKALNPGGEAAQGGAGGGGIFSSLLRIGLGALGGLFGGGGGFIKGAVTAGVGGKSGGGFVPAGQWYWRGEEGPELVKAGPSGDSVLSYGDSMALAGAGGNTTVNIYAQDVSAAFARETISQAKRRISKLSRGR
jgi:hypothetical protein